LRRKKKIILIVTSGFLTVLVILVLYAFVNTWGKTELLVSIHINEKLVRESGFGESPTFAIWLEKPESGETHTLFATRRAAEGDWEGKAEVPVALPKWFDVQEKGKITRPGENKVDAYSGATPKPGFFTINANLEPGSKWICWIEVNMAGDFNDYYPGNKLEENEKDKYLSGQPAIVYRSEVTATIDAKINPEIVGMTGPRTDDGEIIQPLKGITTAAGIFDEIKISVVKPKPRIIRKNVF
jgi:hypothetical protein